MSRLVPYPAERTVLHAQVALQLIDEFTGQPPQGRIDITLRESVSKASLPIRPRTSSLGIYHFPGLGEKLRESAEYLVRIESEYYEGVEVSGLEVQPYARDMGLTGRRPDYLHVGLRPNQNYPYANHIPVIRGRVWDSAGIPAVGASVDYGTAEFTRTGQDGFFSLPVRWLPTGLWPATDITLAVNTATKVLVVSETSGITRWTRLELAESHEHFHLTSDAADGEYELPVNLPDNIDLSGDPDLFFEESFLAPHNRRYRIDSVESTRESLLLQRPLLRSLPRGTRFSLRTAVAESADQPADDGHLLQVASINVAANQITLATSPTRRWSAGTRVIRYPSRHAGQRQPLELDINDPRPREERRQGQHQALVAVPDHFRFMDIQLPT